MKNVIETTIKSAVDLDKGAQKTQLRGLFATGDGEAHKIEITVTRGGAPVDLSGASVTGSFIRARDNATVPLTGSASENVALISLSSACYNASGAFSIAVRLTLGGQKHTVFYGDGSIVSTSTDTIIDDENIIPSLDDLLAQIDAMEAGTQAANNAASAANSASSAANSAAESANSAASSANAQAGAAQAAAQKIDGMVVSAQTLAAGSQATAQVTDDGAKKIIAFGIPKGDKGDTGATPEIAIGTVTTGEPGTEASAAMTGTPEAPVLSLTIPRGMPGTGSVSSVNSVLPNADGDVKLDGLIYPTTAQALEAMSQEQQAALYAQGYRAIVATYNETTTMHALAADGSLAWVGDRPQQMLINSNFSVAQAGYGGAHGATVYAADMWIGDQATYSGKAGGGIVVASGDSNMYIHQRFAVYPAGRAMTLAMSVNGVVACSSGVLPESGTSLFFQNGNANAYVSKEQNEVVITVFSGNTLTIDYCILLDGQYTKKTLPPWVAPDPSVELLKCMAYYQTVKSFYLSGTNTSVRISPPMRLTPTVTGVAQEYVSGSGWENTENVTFSANRNDNIRLHASDANSKTYAVTLSLVADL